MHYAKLMLHCFKLIFCSMDYDSLRINIYPLYNIFELLFSLKQVEIPL